MKELAHNEQRTPVWHEDRLGKFTSSEIHKLMTEPKDKSLKLSKTAESYIIDKVSEQLTGLYSSFENEATIWGVEQETLAKHWFTKLTGIEVKDCGFIDHDSIPNYGGSPDGIIEVDGEIGIIEVKCPFNTSNHIKHCLTDSENFKTDFKEYYYQMQSNMLIVGASFGFFVSFDPRIDKDCGLFIMKINYDVLTGETILNKVELANEMVESIKQKLTNEEKKV